MSENKTPKQASQQTFSLFGNAGIVISASEFLVVDSKPQKIVVTGVRAPSVEDSDAYFEVPGNKRTPIWKKLGNGQQTVGNGPAQVPILAVVECEQAGRSLVWEISSSRAARALESAVQSLPCEVSVKKTGSGLATDYIVAKVA